MSELLVQKVAQSIDGGYHPVRCNDGYKARVEGAAKRAIETLLDDLIAEARQTPATIHWRDGEYTGVVSVEQWLTSRKAEALA